VKSIEELILGQPLVKNVIHKGRSALQIGREAPGHIRLGGFALVGFRKANEVRGKILRLETKQTGRKEFFSITLLPGP